MEWQLKKMLSLLLELIIWCYMVHGTAVENRECRVQEYRDEAGDCVACRQCGSGQELSMECGFGYGAGARCAPCRPGCYKEAAGGQKCKPCLSCAHTSRLQRANCTATGNTVCGDCLPGFYRKTKLSGFQDMDCVPCGDSPRAYEPLCSSRVNLVPLSSVVASPRDTVLAVVICISLASVLLALMLFCAIYCKRQLEKKPHEPCQGGSCYDAEFPSVEHIQVHQIPHQTTSNCYHGTGITCGPAKLFPYQFSEEPCSMEHSSGFHLHCSQNSNGMATYPAWESQIRPLENTLPREVNHDLYQTDLEVSDEELSLEDDGTLTEEKTWSHAVSN